MQQQATDVFNDVDGELLKRGSLSVENIIDPKIGSFSSLSSAIIGTK
jgi:hypothetical protein